MLQLVKREIAERHCNNREGSRKEKKVEEILCKERGDEKERETSIVQREGNAEK